MKKFLVFLGLSAGYRVLLDLIYSQQIAPFFSYAHFINEANSSSLIVSWTMLLLYSIVTYPFYKEHDDKKFVISMIALLIYLIKLVPLTSLLYFQPQSLSFVVQQLTLWILLFFLMQKGSAIEIGSIKKTPIAVTLVTIVVSVAVLIVSGVYANFRLHLSLADVYDLRLEARSFNMPTILKYIYSFSSNMIPVCMVYYIIQKRKAMVYLLAFIGLLNFSIAGSKTTLFLILLSLIFYYFKKAEFNKYLVPVFISVVALAALEFISLHSNSISTLLIRRSFFMPNLLDVEYYEYLKNSSPVFFDTSKYTQIQFNIGDVYFGSEDVRANNGFFTDAFINLGSLGCVVYPFIYSILFRALEGACKGLDRCISVFCAFLMVTTLESTFFTTALLTHGLFLMMVTLYFMPVSKNNIS